MFIKNERFYYCYSDEINLKLIFRKYKKKINYYNNKVISMFIDIEELLS